MSSLEKYSYPLKLPDLHINRLCGVLLGGGAHLTLWIGNTLTIPRKTLIHSHKSLNLIMNSISIIKNSNTLQMILQ